MTLTDLKSKLAKYWIVIFFGGFFIIFILLYLALNPSRPSQTVPAQQTFVPPDSQPATNPFANKPQTYQIADNVRSFSVSSQTTNLSVTTVPVDVAKIAGVFNFNPENAQELATDLGPRKVFVDQNRTLGIDDLSITYRNPQNQTGTADFDSIKSLAQNTLQSVTSNPLFTLSEAEFHSSTNQTGQPISLFEKADFVTFKILSSVNNLPVATDRTPALSVGYLTFDRSGTIISFGLITADFKPENALNIISTSNAIEKLINNESVVIQANKIIPAKTDEGAFDTTNFKSVNIESVQVAYYFPTTKNPQTIFPFYIFSGTAISNDDQKYQLLLAVEAVIKTQ